MSAGSDWVVSSGNRRSYGVTLDATDGAELFPNWESLPWKERYTALQQRADSLVIVYLMQEQAISREFGAQRLREIKGG